MPCGLPAWRSPPAEDGVITFHIVDQVDNLGVTYTPEVQQFRTGNGKTCILTSCCSHWEAAFDLKVNPRRPADV